MKSQRFIDRLTAHQERKRRDALRPARSIQAFVRLHLDDITEAKATLTWDEIAASLKENGLTWRTGNPVSGKDLRALVSRLRRTIDPDEQTRRPQKRPAAGHVAAASPPPPRQGTDPVPAAGPRAKQTDPGKILQEMQRAAAERKPAAR